MANKKPFILRDRETKQVLDIYFPGQDVNVNTDGTFKSLPDAIDELQEEIGEVGTGSYTKPPGGIPYNDLSQGVRGTLDEVANKVTKEIGKGLSTNDYTTEEKTKLASLSNYNDAELRQQITRLQTALDNLMNGESVTDAIDTFTEVTAFLNGINTDDEKLAARLLALDNAIKAVNQALLNKANTADVYTKQQANDRFVAKETGMSLMSQEEHDKLDGLSNYDDQNVWDAIDNIQDSMPSETVVINSDGANIVDEHDNNSVLLAPSARQMKLMCRNFMALFNSLAGIAFTDGRPTLDWVGSKTKYALSYGTLTGCTADVAAGQVNEGALRIKLTPTQASYAFTSVTVNGESVATTATGDADGSVYLDTIVNGNITVAATAISGRGITFNGTGCSIGAAGVAIGQDLDTTITANEHYTLPSSITVKIGNTNVAHTYTRAQDNKSATLHIDAANITGDLTITCTAVEDAHVTLVISGSNFVVKQGSTELSNGSKVYNGSAAQTLTIEPASGYKFSTLPSADKGTMTNNGPYEASSLEIGTSVSGTLTITAAATGLQTFSIDLSGLVGVTSSNDATSILEGSSYSTTLSKTDASAAGSVIIGTCTMGNEDITPPSGNTISVTHVTGHIVIAAIVGVQPSIVHSYARPTEYDVSNPNMRIFKDKVGNFDLYPQSYSYTPEGASEPTTVNNYSTNNYPAGYYANGKKDDYRVGRGNRALDIPNDSSFTIVLKDVFVLFWSGSVAYDSQQWLVKFYDRATVNVGLQDTVGQFQMSISANDSRSGNISVGENSTEGMWPVINYQGSSLNTTKRFYQEGATGKIFGYRAKIAGTDTYTNTYHIVMSYNHSTKTAKAWVVDIDNVNNTKTVKFSGELNISGKLILPCIAMKSEQFLGGLDVYNYAMTEQQIATVVGNS